MMRRALAVFLALHGVVHFIGAAVAWRLMTSPDNPYTTTVLWGNIDLGETGITIVGAAWLLPLAAFVVAAVGLWLNRGWALPAVLIAAVLSLAICLLGMPAAVAGLVIDVLLIGLVGALLLVRRLAPGRSVAPFAR